MQLSNDIQYYCCHSKHNIRIRLIPYVAVDLFKSIGCCEKRIVKMTISFECHKVNGKHLLINFVFESVKCEKDRIVPDSVDKYMTLDVWNRLYEKLKKPIQKYERRAAEMPTGIILTMEQAQLHLRISWQKVDAMHLKLCDVSARDTHPYLMVVEVLTVSLVKNFIRKVAKSKPPVASESKNTESKWVTPIDVNAIRASTRQRKHEEYVPGAVTTLPTPSSLLSYTPSKSVKTEADEYTPVKRETNDAGATERIDQNHKYFPTPINNNNYKDTVASHPFSRGQIKSPRPNKVRPKTTTTVPEPGPSNSSDLSQDLFGSESDTESETLPRKEKTPRPVRKAKIPATATTTSSSMSAYTRMKRTEVSSTSSALSGPAAKRVKVKENREPNVEAEPELVIDDNHMESLIAPIAISSVQTTEKSKYDIESETTNEIIRQKIKDNTLVDSRGNQVGLTRVIDLKDMSVEQLENTFDDHATALRAIYDARKNGGRSRVNDFCFVSVCSLVITNDQMVAMAASIMKKLDADADGHTPCAQLFFEQLVPEWALLIFMKRYQLTRTDALEQIIKHEKAYSLNVPTDFDRFSLDQ